LPKARVRNQLDALIKLIVPRNVIFIPMQNTSSTGRTRIAQCGAQSWCEHTVFAVFASRNQENSPWNPPMAVLAWCLQ
jgi:hypothetical protein